MFESKAGVLFVGGLGFFAFAFVSNALVPIFMYQDIEEQHVLQYVTASDDDIVTKETTDELGEKVTVWYLRVEKPRPDAVAPPWLIEDEDGQWLERLGLPAPNSDLPRRVTKDENGNYRVARGLAANNPRVMAQFEDLSRRYPDSFAEYYGEPTYDSLEDALLLGRQVYTGEGCWHCHSQFVRPVSNESRRWGPVAETWEYQNQLQRPVMFGTRRVGPDLSREGGRRSNDWHAVHFFQPTMVSTGSPMPAYPWLYDEEYLVEFKDARGNDRRTPTGETNDYDLAVDSAYDIIESAYDLSRVKKDAEQPNSLILAVKDGEPIEVQFTITKKRHPGRPNHRGLALITYVQWLGSWLDSYPYYEQRDELSEEEFQ